MEDYLNYVRELTERLRAIGETVKISYIVAVILGGLPETYYPLITALEAKEESDLTVEYVSEKLRDEAKRKESQMRTLDDSTVALASNHIRTSTDQYKRNRILCHRCGQEGHIKRNCRLIDYTANNKYSEIKPRREPYNRNQEESGAYYSESRTSPQDFETRWKERERREDTEDEIEEWALTGINSMEEDENVWIIDSGASSHMVSDKDSNNKILELKTPMIIQMANGDTMEATGKCNMLLNILTEKVSQQIKINNVLIIPKLKHKLLSVNMLCQDGYIVEFEGSKCTIKMNSLTMAVANKIGNIYKLNCEPTVTNGCFTCIHEWHARLGHRNLQGIKSLSTEKIVKNMNITPCRHNDFCRACKLGAMYQISFKSSRTTNERPFQTIVSDICGPISPSTMGGKIYLLTLTDNYSNYTYVDLLMNKSDTALSVINFMKASFNRFRYWPETFRSDGGGEYCGDLLENFLKSQGIVHQTTVPNTPMQNGKSERKNHTLFNMIRCMLKGKKLPLNLWGEAARTAVHILNKVQHSNSVVTPHEMWTGHKPNIGYFREFGCTAYAYVDKIKRNKLSDTAVEGLFVGYGIGKKGYRIWIPGTRKIINAATASFAEGNKDTKCAKPNKISHNEQQEFYSFDQTTEGTIIPPDKASELRRSTRSTRGVPAERLTY